MPVPDLSGYHSLRRKSKAAPSSGVGGVVPALYFMAGPRVRHVLLPTFLCSMNQVLNVFAVVRPKLLPSLPRLFSAVGEAMVAVAAPLLAASQGQESETYYFLVDLDNTKGASLGLALAARPDGFLV